MRRLLLVLLLVACPAFAQENGWTNLASGWGPIQTPTTVGVSTASPCSTVGQVPVYLASPLTVGCITNLVWTAAPGTFAAPAGTGTGVARIGGALTTNVTSAATTGLVEEVLATYTVPANTLSANGRCLRITAWGTTVANANSKTISIRIGGIGGTIVSTITTTASAAPWNHTVNMARLGSATHTAGGVGRAGTALNTTSTASLSANTAATIDIVVTATTPTTIGDATFSGLVVETVN